MQSNNIVKPSFFKVVRYPHAKFTPLPKKWNREHYNNDHPSHFIIQSDSGKSYTIQTMFYEDHQLCIGGGWRDILRDHNCRPMDINVFEEMDHTTLRMISFDLYDEGLQKFCPANRLPMCCHVVLNPFQTIMKLPRQWVTANTGKYMMPLSVTITTVGGFKGKVKQIVDEEGYIFIDGWGNIMKNLDIKFGDFLVFNKNNERNIQLHVYSPNAYVKPTAPFNGLTQHPALFLKRTIKVENETLDEAGPSQPIGQILSPNLCVNDNNRENLATIMHAVGHHPFQPTSTHNNVRYKKGIYHFCDVAKDSNNIYVWFTVPAAHLWRLPKEFNELPELRANKWVSVVDTAQIRWSWKLINEARNGDKKLSVSSGWGSYLNAHELNEGDECLFSYKLGSAEFHQLHVPRI